MLMEVFMRFEDDETYEYLRNLISSRLADVAKEDMNSLEFKTEVDPTNRLIGTLHGIHALNKDERFVKLGNFILGDYTTTKNLNKTPNNRIVKGIKNTEKDNDPDPAQTLEVAKKILILPLSVVCV